MKEWLGRASLYLFCILLTSQGQNEMAAAGFLAAAALDSLTVLLTGKALTVLYLCCVGGSAHWGRHFYPFFRCSSIAVPRKRRAGFCLVFLLPILGRFSLFKPEGASVPFRSLPVGMGDGFGKETLSEDEQGLRQDPGFHQGGSQRLEKEEPGASGKAGL